MRHPYVGQPQRQFWTREPGIADPASLDPVGEVPFRLKRSDRIVTAGSCFAQHVARFLSQSGYDHYIAEPAHPFIRPGTAKKYHYGLFSARYGNIYTARQLLQLLQRAHDLFEPADDAWPAPQADRFVDPFRPQIQPGGFLSKKELRADRAHHLSRVRDAVAKMDVFVFTLGLTESWRDRRDGAVFPLAPGVAGGIYDPDLVEFVNFDETSSYEDLRTALNFIRAINPAVRIILTVSPVPLNATYENRHVLLSTTWSKAVLRIVAEKATREFRDCVYFPSYEIITSPHVRGQYYAADCREIRPKGVDHVMRLFLQHFSEQETAPAASVLHPGAGRAGNHLREMEGKIQILCDEAAISDQ